MKKVDLSSLNIEDYVNSIDIKKIKKILFQIVNIKEL